MNGTLFPITAQVLGGIAVFLGFVSYQVKTTKTLLVIHMSTCLVFCLHYLLLGAMPAFALNTAGVFRNIVYNNKQIKFFSYKIWPYVFAVIMLILGLLSWQGWVSLLVIAGLIINTVSLSFSNPQNIRRSILVSSPLVLIYDVLVFSVGGAIYEATVIISSIIGLYRYRKTSNES